MNLTILDGPPRGSLSFIKRHAIFKRTAKIDAKKKELDALNPSDMEDELRKSGGGPGWAR